MGMEQKIEEATTLDGKQTELQIPESPLSKASLRQHYLLITILSAIFIIAGALWSELSLIKANTETTNNLKLRNYLNHKNNSIQDSLWLAYYHLENYMATQNPDSRSKIHISLNQATSDATELTTNEWIVKNKLQTTASDIASNLSVLNGHLTRVMKLRDSPSELYPAMDTMRQVMMPSNNEFKALITLALEETTTATNTDTNFHIHVTLDHVRDNWSAMISSFRLLIAGRFGTFGDALSNINRQHNNIELMHNQIVDDLNKLRAMDHKGLMGFQTSNLLHEMESLLNRWHTAYRVVKKKYTQENWRKDIPYMQDTINPLYQKIWQQLEQIEHAAYKKEYSDIQTITQVANQIRITLWSLAILTTLLIVISYSLLEHTILRPVSRIADALWSEAKGGKDVHIPGSSTREMQQLTQAFEQMRSRVHERQRDLKHMATHDALTSLPNREFLQTQLEYEIDEAQRNNSTLALLMIDLDHFKEINDTLGHQVGDGLLQKISERFRAALRSTDTVARLGGDEFAVLLPGSNNASAQEAAARFLKVLDREFKVIGNKLYIAASIGIAMFPDHGTNTNTLIKHADVAMYNAKRSNTGFEIYDKSTDGNSLERLTLVKDLRNAIINDTLQLCYQPKTEIKTGYIFGAEALLRWNHSERGMIPPDEIVHLAESNGLIGPLTAWVINNALRQCALWRNNGIIFNIAINLSALNLQDSDFLNYVNNQLNAWDIPPSLLIFEITESAMMADPNKAIRILSKLNNIGIRISVDDFGTGFSSLSYLNKLPVSELKIDRSFIMNMLDNANDQIIVKSTIDLAHSLGLQVVAEGIENQLILDKLNELDCDIAQGYHICRPQYAPELTNWLSTTDHRRMTTLHDTSETLITEDIEDIGGVITAT